MTFFGRSPRGSYGILLAFGILTLLARAAEPEGLRRFGVASYWSSVQSISWALVLLLPWLQRPWGFESGGTVLSRDARLLPWRTIGSTLVRAILVTTSFASAYLLIACLCDLAFGGRAEWDRALAILLRVWALPCPLAVMLPALAERLPSMLRVLAAGSIVLTLVVLSGGGVAEPVATLARGTSSMDRFALRACGALVLLALCGAAFAHTVLTGRRSR